MSDRAMFMVGGFAHEDPRCTVNCCVCGRAAGSNVEDKPTSGPWRHITRGAASILVVGPGSREERELVATVGGVEANARLIAAAPDLLAVVKMAQAEAVTLKARLPEPYAGNMERLADACRDAIARAEGGAL